MLGIKLYHSLPSVLRTTAASLYGFWLQRRRYGPETERLVQEALEREHWPPERWKAWQEERLAFTLHRAAAKVPYYREYWRKHAAPGTKPWEELSNWPILTKEPLRANPRAFLAEDCKPRRMYEEHTSGSTGTPLTLLVTRETIRAWYALFEARWRRWNGVSRHDRWAIIGGQRVIHIDRTIPPFWVWNAPMRQLYISAYHIASWSARAVIEEMVRRRVVYLYGYASAMTELARELLEQQIAAPQLLVAVSNAEPLYPWQREIIERAFGCRVVNTYGMSEMVAAGSECWWGGMHLWPEAGLVEILDEHNVPVPPGASGKLVCTGLLNDAMPLIRYEVGDRGALAPKGTSCPCGRSLPLLANIEGRLDDLVITPDGRRIGRLDTVFKAALPIRQAQIVQTHTDRVLVRVVPGEGFHDGTRAEIARAVADRVGPSMRIQVDLVEQIPRGANGKFRMVLGMGAFDRRD